MSGGEEARTAAIVVGPLLRYVDATSALVWVETDRPCTVRVLGTDARTFTVHGHHYGVVEIDGLTPGTSTRYDVALDGRVAWPEPGSPFPHPRIRTPDTDHGTTRLVFGSCRMSVPHDSRHDRVYGIDALRAYALGLTVADDADWPDLVALLGDQVYADETSPAAREVMAARRDLSEPPGAEIADFEEYTQLYRIAWTDPAVRWLLSTVPSAMLFDDHDVRDDWNTSATWREQMERTPWWRDRIVGGIGAYWLYQHLGNLSPAERADDPVLAAMRAADGDAGSVLDEFASTADRDPPSYRWSFVRDLGPVRLVMIDSRCGRMLEPGRRTIVDDDEWSWIESQARSAAHADHLLIGSSLPYLLPQGLHDLEEWNEAVADGAWGRWCAAPAEALRQAVDLEHWAAFGRSFRAMARLVTEIATTPDGPGTISFLSGDVHYSYGARMSYPGESARTSRVHQLVCSPLRNPLSRTIRYLNGAAAFAVARVVGSALMRLARVPDAGVDWSITSGPRFDNALATLELSNGAGRVRWHTACKGSDGAPVMDEIMSAQL
ncbi:PhoD-like phosphatase [Haloactinopolyspora alba]|uniref:PhoD-like phosphatase n=1 Tax=Haloactinopolyspora alba TaxID=648780 RepID=A0A2P8EFR2_9ACTN|nr:alkaline phosphatase D family protein [Haloactinopolyspora alba]PSL08299.1 PhoD-like phosphatase [Haloactinopolyspora alba]